MNIHGPNITVWKFAILRKWFSCSRCMSVIATVLLSLSIAGTGAAQAGRIFYKVCESNGQRYVDFQRDSITVRTLDDNLIEFISDRANPSSYSAKRVAGFDLMEGGKDAYNIDRFYAAKVDDNSFFVMQKGGVFTGFSYFHADQRRANSNDKAVRCAFDRLVHFEADVDAYLEKRKELDQQKQSEFDAQTKGVTTEFVKNMRSQRVDPILEKGIRAWWRGAPDAVVIDPMLRITFVQSNYDVVRNEYGTVLRKTIDTIYVFKRSAKGKCFAAWRSFGYESYGGGAFSDEVKDWVKRDWAGVIKMPGDRKLTAAEGYEVDCAAFAQ